ISDLLSVFEKYTVIFSGSYYPTTHLVLPAIVNIIGALKKYMNHDFLKEIVIAMFNKFGKYFTQIPVLFIVSSILDPRVKSTGLQTGLKVYYDSLREIGVSIYTQKDVDDIYEQALSHLNNLYEVFEGEFGVNRS
ncbi:hypothetical protein M569_02854, partial [Genlisea aurea]